MDDVLGEEFDDPLDRLEDQVGTPGLQVIAGVLQEADDLLVARHRAEFALVAAAAYRHPRAFASLEAPHPVFVETVEQLEPLRAAAQHSHPVQAVDHRNLRHHRLGTPFESGRVDDDRSTEAGAPNPDPLRIDFVPGLQVTDGVAVVLDFVEWKKLAARLAFAFAEAAIVDSQRDVTGPAEVAPFFDQRLLDEAEPMADNQSRAPPALVVVRKIKIAGAI